MIAQLFSLGFLAAALRISVPYVYAALGSTLSERAGVIQIGVEGMLLFSAFTATLGAWFGHSASVGLVAGMAGGVALAALFALVVVELGADAIVSGVALNLLADGLSRFGLRLLFDSDSNSPRVASAGDLVGLLWLAAPAAVLACQLLVYRTPFGLGLRAVGDRPEAARAAGLCPRRVRWRALLSTGALGGLGGSWLAAEQHQFVAGMSNGRGFIALAAMILGGWRPLPAALACLLFGLGEALEIALQTGGGAALFPGWVAQMLPYLLTILALAGLGRRAKPPSALGGVV